MYDFERTYDSLLYPLLTSEECVPEKAIFAIDTTTKKLGPRVHAEILTRFGPSEMSILLVPAIEIAKLVLTYKNALLSYNPRSYLEFEKQGTNLSIKESITSNNYDEFALFNNGVTMIANRCEYSERTGKPNVASLSIYEPQIINGGQTAFTLAQVLSETDELTAETIFQGKEVLLKVIALGNIEAGSREPLAIDISRAANTQTAVTYADRKANTAMHKHIAFRFFELTGLLYEYKTGLFDTAKRADCIDGEVILDRNLFHRLLYAAQGNFNMAAKSKLMQKGRGVSESHPSDEDLMRTAELFELFKELEATGRRLKSLTDYLRDVSVGWGVIEAAKIAQLNISTKQVANLAAKRWESFLTFSLNAFEEIDPDLLKSKERKRKVGSLVTELNNGRWKHTTSMHEDLIRFGKFLLEREDLMPTPPPPAVSPTSA